MLRKICRNFSRYGSKILILGLLLISTFSSIGVFFQISEVQAAGKFVCNPLNPSGVPYEVGESENCKNGFTKVEVDENGYDVNSNAVCDNLSSCIASVVYVFTAGLGSVMAYLGAWILSLAIAISLNSSAYALTFLTTGWETVRDIANMFFILILVYIAFTVMFRAETADTMKRLAWVIVIALVINFSFFFVRVVIDAGNLLAVQFYNAIPGQPLVQTIEQGAAGTAGNLTATATTYLGAGEATKDLTSVIMNGIGVQNILNTSSFQKFREQNNAGVLGSLEELIALSVIYIAVGAILFILAAMFFTVGIKFIFRVAILWLLLIVSPLAFIARTIKKGEEYYNKWQDALILHAFYPAVFLFVFYVLTLFMEQLVPGCNLSAGPCNNNSVISGIFGGIGDAGYGNWFTYIVNIVANIGIRLGFVVALVYIGLKASEVMGVAGASFAKMATGKVFGAGFGALGFAGRNSIGLGGQTIARSNWARDLASQKGPRGLLGGGVLRAGSFFGTRSFDARAVGATRAGAGAIGLDLGKAGGTGGYAESFKKSVERKTKFADRLEPDEAQLEAARKQAMSEMSDDDRKKLAHAAKAYNEQLELQKVGGADRNDVKVARKAYTETLKGIKIGEDTFADRVKKIAGVDNKKNFAKTLETRSMRNLWGVASSGLPGKISNADHQAAVKIRGVKKEDDAKHLQELLKNIYGLDPDTSGVAIGAGGSAFDRRTMEERIASIADPERRKQAEERLKNWQEGMSRMFPQTPPPSSQPQMTSTIPAQRSGSSVQFGGPASYSSTSGAFVGRPGMTEEQYNKGVAELGKAIAEQGKLTRTTIEKGAHEQAALTREGLKLGGEKLTEVVKEIKKGEIKAEGRSERQIEETRRGAEATTQATEKVAEEAKTSPAKPAEPPKPEEKK